MLHDVFLEEGSDEHSMHDESCSEESDTYTVFVRVWSCPGELGVPVDPEVRGDANNEQQLEVAHKEQVLPAESHQHPTVPFPSWLCGTTGCVLLTLLFLAAWVLASISWYLHGKPGADEIEWEQRTCSLRGLVDQDTPEQSCCTLSVSTSSILNGSPAPSTEEQVAGSDTLALESSMDLVTVKTCSDLQESACNAVIARLNDSYPCFVQARDDQLEVGGATGPCFEFEGFEFENAVPALDDACIAQLSQGTLRRDSSSGVLESKLMHVLTLCLAAVSTLALLLFCVAAFRRRRLAAEADEEPDDGPSSSMQFDPVPDNYDMRTGSMHADTVGKQRLFDETHSYVPTGPPVPMVSEIQLLERHDYFPSAAAPGQQALGAEVGNWDLPRRQSI